MRGDTTCRRAFLDYCSEQCRKGACKVGAIHSGNKDKDM